MTAVKKSILLSLLLTLGLTPHLFAGTALVSSRETKEYVEPEPEEVYYGARGLITLSGPAGMFINPTSGTLAQGKYTFQYCLFWPNRDTDVVGHGWLLGIGVTDWLEVGAVANLADRNANFDDEEFAIGPQVRVRLLRDQEWWPEISVGGYSRWGSHALNEIDAYIALSKRFIVSERGFVRSVAMHGGYRHTWFDNDAPVGDTPNFYSGLEIEFPYRIYLIGEISSKDNNVARKQPFAVGLQCRLPGVALTVAALNTGKTDRVGLYSGIGISFGF